MANVEIKSEVTGIVWEILCKVGDRIEAEAPIMIIESMKMEVPVIATTGGVVHQILVEDKTAVAEGQTVAILTS